MGADGLTKMAAGLVMTILRGILNGILPKVPSATAELAIHRPAPRIEPRAVANSVCVSLPMTVQRRNAEQFAYRLMENDGKVSDEQLVHMLSLWGFAKNHHRPNVAPKGSSYVFSECFGLVRDRTGRWMQSTVTTMFPNVAKVLNRWLRDRLRALDHPAFDEPLHDWRWSSCTVNKGYAAERHRDANNYGPSIVRSFGSNRGDGLYLWTNESNKSMESLSRRSAALLDIHRSDRLVAFDGTLPHETKRLAGNMSDRYSVIFFMAKGSWNSPSEVLDDICELGCNPPRNAAEADRFGNKFNQWCDSRGFGEWSLPIDDIVHCADSRNDFDVLD